MIHAVQTMLRLSVSFQKTIKKGDTIALLVLMVMLTELLNSNFWLYVSIEENGNLRLIDGDRQGTVFTEYFKLITDELARRVDKINSMNVMQIAAPTKPSIGFIQTYYANYSSSEYLQKQHGM